MHGARDPWWDHQCWRLWLVQTSRRILIRSRHLGNLTTIRHLRSAESNTYWEYGLLLLWCIHPASNSLLQLQHISLAMCNCDLFHTCATLTFDFWSNFHSMARTTCVSTLVLIVQITFFSRAGIVFYKAYIKLS